MAKRSTPGGAYPDSERYFRPYYQHYAQRTQKERRSDEEILAEIQAKMIEDDTVDPQGIDVRVETAKVTLTGHVGSTLAKRAAGDDAWDAQDVADVDNRLEITG